MAPDKSFDNLDFIVDRSRWSETRWIENQIDSDLAPGQVVFRVDRFAFTANNISYAMAGDMLKYWNFFPAQEGWGRIPTMGFGEIVASSCEGAPVGTRCFGFYPMSRYLLIEPSSANPTSIVDGVAHRGDLAAAYNQYQPVGGDALYSKDHEDELMLMRGLFMTSFLAEDFLADSDLYGAKSVVISSASSKTSIALAFMLAHKGQVRSIGLTLARNREFVEGLGFYDQVVSYDEIRSLPSDVPTVFVDMAGNAKVTLDVHETFGANLKYSQTIGGTHWDAGSIEGEMPGPKREFFFAPGQIAKRIGDWGAQGFQEKLGSAWQAFQDKSSSWLKVERGYGREAVERVFAATLAGHANPATGHVISLWDNEDEAAGR